MSTQAFKVIIAGGGPVGLTAALALSRSNIDFVLLESHREIITTAGANLVMMPIGLRALSQLGLYHDVCKVSTPLGVVKRFNSAGRSIGDANWFLHMKENHGEAPRVISRRDLTNSIYSAIPASQRTNILPGKQLTQIQETRQGVKVSCADGTSYSGTMVIGADGAHSAVRDQMRTLGLANNHESINDEEPFLTTFRAMWMRFPTPAGAAPGTVAETHSHGIATQLFSGPETTVVGIYEQLPSPIRGRVRYSRQDQDSFANRWATLPLLPAHGVTVASAYDASISSAVVNLEEGVVQHWSYGGRIALVGDAAHKFTPSLGTGCNNGIIDVIVLANQLRSLTRGSQWQDRAKVQEALTAYQAARMETVSKSCEASGNATATSTWQNGIYKFVDTHVLALSAVQKLFIKLGASEVAKTPALDGASQHEQFVGKVPWVKA